MKYEDAALVDATHADEYQLEDDNTFAADDIAWLQSGIVVFEVRGADSMRRSAPRPHLRRQWA